MYDIAFVILNYNVFEETVSCVSSILNNIDTDNYSIVIVDNNSPNKSGIKLKRYYTGHIRVKVFVNDENVGFARGNNIGISYIRERDKGARFICCINNDTLIEQGNIYSAIKDIYEGDNSIAVIGPRIYDRFYIKHSGMGGFQSVETYRKLMEDSLKNGKDPRIINSKSTWKRRLLQNKLIYDINQQRRIIEKNFKGRLLLNKNKTQYYANIRAAIEKNGYKSGRYDQILHGCFLIFTEAFFKELNGFEPKTFMYGEEPILFLDVINHNLHTFQSDNIHIRHLEDVSVDASWNLNEKKRLRHKYEMESMRVLINKMEEYDQSAKKQQGI